MVTQTGADIDIVQNATIDFDGMQTAYQQLIDGYVRAIKESSKKSWFVSLLVEDHIAGKLNEISRSFNILSLSNPDMREWMLEEGEICSQLAGRLRRLRDGIYSMSPFLKPTLTILFMIIVLIMYRNFTSINEIIFDLEKLIPALLKFIFWVLVITVIFFDIFYFIVVQNAFPRKRTIFLGYDALLNKYSSLLGQQKSGRTLTSPFAFKLGRKPIRDYLDSITDRLVNRIFSKKYAIPLYKDNIETALEELIRMGFEKENSNLGEIIDHTRNLYLLEDRLFEEFGISKRREFPIDVPGVIINSIFSLIFLYFISDLTYSSPAYIAVPSMVKNLIFYFFLGAAILFNTMLLFSIIYKAKTRQWR